MVPQSDMDFGQYLRQARERRGVTLRQIATATRISPRTLEALENNEIRKLPGGIFSRAFVRSYAHEVGLDPDETVRRFLQQFPVDDVTQGSPLVEHTHTHLEATEDEERQRQVAGLLIALAVGVPLIALIAYFTFSRPASTASTTDAGRVTSADAATDGGAGQAPAGTGGVAPGSTAQGSGAPGDGAGAGTPVAGGATTAGGTAPMPPGGAAPGAAGTANPAGLPGGATSGSLAPIGDGLRITITARGPCWMRLSADGTVRYQGTLQPGDQQTIDARDALHLEVGDAGVVSFTLNGRPGKQLGIGGQVVRANIRRANMADWLAAP